MTHKSEFGDTEKLPLEAFTEKAYLDYSMFVILDRALPHIGDGLKPVQRRIVYAMSELGLKSNTKFKKSARTVGDVLGKYHPHSDVACYEAMVLMAQDFAYRYPLIDGQGNWGSPDDPKSFAAMRYTEARLTHYAQILLAELQQGTTDWKPNFDASLKEPTVLPARLPNLLLNGTSGIAVGMATDIPPHNLTEVTEACIYLLDHPNAGTQALYQYIKGPDFPTGAEIITPPEELYALYDKGTGTVRQRAIYKKEGSDIIITALPYQVSGSRVLEQIAAQMLSKKLTHVSDLRDESDHENPTRLVITPRSNKVDIKALMSHLFATTDLERNYRVNLNIIGLNGKPEVKSLTKLLTEWLEFRTETVRRRLQFRLEQVKNRLHLLEALLIVFLNINKVIEIIREEEDPKTELMEQLKLTEIQANAILEIKLRQLAKLEEIKIKAEQAALSKERQQLEQTLASKTRLKTLLRKEFKEDLKSFGDPRQSPIVTRPEAQAFKKEDFIPTETITVVLSEKGWIRAAKGHEVDAHNLNYRAGDRLLMQATGKSNQSVVLIDSQGKSYSFSAHTLPSARGQGEPLTSRLKPEPGSHFVAVLIGANEDHYLLASDAGYGFITSLTHLHCKNKTGKTVLKLPSGARVLPPQKIDAIEEQYLAVLTSEGRLLLFPINTLPQLPRGKGNQLIALPAKKGLTRTEYCLATAVLSKKDTLIVKTQKRSLRLRGKELFAFEGKRGLQGKKLPRGFQKALGLTVEE